MFQKRILALIALIFSISMPALAQQRKTNPAKTGIYVDKSGVMRWEKDDKEAAFFGVNYTAPFAYGYRSIQRTGVSVEQAIKDDVYHFSRLGLDAFRVHVWDTEIADSVGNLLNNEHLRLFDFLIAELKKRNIKAIITPIAFWGNGYPEKDQDLGGFSSKYGKNRALLEEDAFVAQERFLKQFFQHKNAYTGLTYQNDPDILATEVNNEPQHSGPPERTTEYVNRMVKSIRSTGWTKPIFYNISESPTYAAAVVKADVQGHSFQWYPTGLVAGHTLKGNYLPNVSQYKIPFDSIPAFKNRAKMVYEFDAGDVLDAYMYPAMAKSFRVAGFQWATQFAYDPMATAYANTEYQTHFLNLAYAPSKAISLLIASHVFHELPRAKPQLSDSTFGAFKVSYKTASSEMNSPEAFYYSSSTTAKPSDLKSLKHLAGVGSSVVLKSNGTGAYFLDKIEDGIWRLEVMPNVIQLRDPFASPAADRPVMGINWEAINMSLNLANLGASFSVKALNAGNPINTIARNGAITIKPGTYLLQSKGKTSTLTAQSTYGTIKLGEFVAPKVTSAAEFEKALAEQQVQPVNEGAEKGLVLFNPARDQDLLNIYNPDWKNFTMQYGKGTQSEEKVLIFKMAAGSDYPFMGFQTYFGEKLKAFGNTTSFKTLVVRLKSLSNAQAKVKVGLIDVNGNFFSSNVMVPTTVKDIEIPLTSLKQDSQLLLPRPYPGFQPLYFKSSAGAIFNLKNAEKLEITFEQGVEINSVYLK
jgi:hypothetical protein